VKSIVDVYECSPVPKDSVPREELPMRDTMVFKSATRVPRVLHSAPHAPHSWVTTALMHILA